MKKIWYIFLFALFSYALDAQDYQISFAISGDSEAILDSVAVYNMDQDHAITLEGNDILHLLATTTGIRDISSLNDEIEIYPNPVKERASIEFQNQKQGLIQLSLFDMGGKLVTQKSSHQNTGKIFVELTGLSMGAYVIQVVTGTSVFKEIILSNGSSGNLPEFIFQGFGDDIAASVTGFKSSSEDNELVTMQYNEGDTLSFTAYQNGFSLKQKIVPVASSTISFGFSTNMEDISTTSEIDINGGELEVSDEAGNVIKINLPRGAVMDSTTVSLTLFGEQKNLAIHERRLRPFEIGPADLLLYRPMEISIEYNSKINNIEYVTLFRMPSDSLLIPLGEHIYAENRRILTASTFFPGDFVEGNLSYAQVNDQFNQLLSVLGISWESTLKSTGMINLPVSNGELHKYIWDETWGNSMGILKLEEQKLLKKPEGEPPIENPTPEEVIEKLCKTVIHEGVQEILDLGLPDETCDRNYIHTLTKMMRDINVLGCVKGEDFISLTEKFEEMLVNCHSYLSINSNLNIEDGGLYVNTNGVVPVFTTAINDQDGTIEGVNSLDVSGGSNVQGSCTSTVSGTTLVEVSGTRDAAYTYVLTLKTNQDALLTTVCPDLTNETPLVGTGTRVVTLTKANNFHVSIPEEVDGGTFIMDVQLINPYTTIPGDE